MAPISYRLGATALRSAQVVRASSVLYAVGGLYGNIEALEAIDKRARAESTKPVIVFNGDFNFLNATPGWWRELNTHIHANHFAMAGNVEVESVAAEPSELGCGCGYPAYVSRGIVQRSDRIVQALRSAALDANVPQLLEWQRGLPMALVAEVGAEKRRVGIVHGDVESLAGWQLGVEAMEPADDEVRAFLGCNEAESFLPITPRSRVAAWAWEAKVNGLLSTHTCLPFGQIFPGLGGAQLAVFNNGSAGMPNFEGTHFGLITRVSDNLAPPMDSLYGGIAAGLRFDALPVQYNQTAWLERFSGVWPEGSDAHTSYHGRLLHGPRGFFPRHAARDGTQLNAAAR